MIPDYSSWHPRKTVLAGGILVDYRFRSEKAYRDELATLAARGILYQVLESFLCDDGCVLVRIIRQYNGVDLIDLEVGNLEV